MIQIAKALGMKTMLGCMVSSSVSVTAAAHLSPLWITPIWMATWLISERPVPRGSGGEGQAGAAEGGGAGLTRA